MNEQPNHPVSLNTQTVKELLDHIQTLLHPDEANSPKQEALLSLKAALERALPFIPEPRQTKPDELEIENEIRDEIVIAGANENGWFIYLLEKARMRLSWETLILLRPEQKVLYKFLTILIAANNLIQEFSYFEAFKF